MTEAHHGKHSYKRCKNSCTIQDCKYGRYHHTLLHKPPVISGHIGEQPLVPSKPAETSEIIAHNSAEAGSWRPLLKVIAVTVSEPRGTVDTYALLDDGSTATFIESDITDIIGAQGPKSSITMDCISGLTKKSEVNFVDITIKGRHSTESHIVKNVRSISNLGIGQQSAEVDNIKTCSHLEDITDFLCYSDAKPKVLIGSDNWHLTIARATRQGTRQQPVAIQTALGWVLYGFTSSKTTPVHFVNHATVSNNHNAEESLESLIRENYRLDAIGITKHECRSVSEEHALKTLNMKTRRLPTGRFETGLLWRPDVKTVPNSYDLALSRFLNLENKFKKDPEFAQAYRHNVNSTIEKGYAEVCANTQPKEGLTWYLPHFGVVHPHKRKLRVVHDAAAMCKGVSLNSLLLPGPDLLQPLLAILMRFREGRVAMSADIREMFPQIKIVEEDRNAQRFLWRDDPCKPLNMYRMSSMMFGATSSPCTAIYIKNKNAQEHEDCYPDAAHSIIHDHYMDDFLGSVDDVAQAAQLISDITTVHNAACFNMRAWVSNQKDALSLLPPEICSAEVSEVGLGSSNSHVRVLGITWNIIDDQLYLLKDLPIKLPINLTKRSALSTLMKVFDPLGFLTPIIIWGRILFQQLWSLGIDWDRKLPVNIAEKWIAWYNHLRSLVAVRIPRCYAVQNDPTERQIHVFADASELAYACVAYWRFEYPDGSVKITLIGGKARLAPLKPTSIPRLELQAALIAARFAVYIMEAHRIKPTNITFWSDSLTVLKWLRSDARSFKAFVAHRVGEILETTNVADWRYTPSAQNVADDATRAEHKIEISSRWFSGPSFLALPQNSWPSEPSTTISPLLEELKKKPDSSEVVGLITNNREPPSPVVANCSRFSDWLRLLRASARVLQFGEIFKTLLQNSKLTSRNTPSTSARVSSGTSSRSLALTTDNLKEAEQNLLLRSQLDSFYDDYVSILNGKPVLKQSRLKHVALLIDEHKMLRLHGRTGAIKDFPEISRNPIVLDGKHQAVRLLIAHLHQRLAHANNETVVNELRQAYYILGLRPSVRRVASDCEFCRIRKTTPIPPPVGDLPSARMAHGMRPFTFVGLDYFGPVPITIGRRTETRHIALFTCLTVRAVHLEIVGNLTMDSAIMAIRRFIARRGCPKAIYSDNGTAFVGANRQLKELYDVADFAANNKIEWKFIPPSAPFMGGCWERLVRSVKTALAVTLKGRAPREEVYLTFLMEAEAIVNSRPLTHVSVDPESEEAVTPFHFILGSSSPYAPLAQVDEADLDRRVQWKKGLRLADHFWARWTKEYLPILTPRSQVGKAQNLKEGDLVFIADGNLPRGTWPRGRITKIFPGKDGIIRVAEVATKAGTLRRPVKKLAPL